MNSGRICISVCASDTISLAESIRRADSQADVIEIRFDCLKPDEVFTALESLPEIRGRYLITYRPSEEGGMRVLPRSERVKFWIRAAKALERGGHLVDHETDLSSNYGVPLDRRIVSTHIFNGLPDDPVINSEAPGLVDAELIKVAANVNDAADAVPLWRLLNSVIESGRECIPIGMGEAGKWTRILGPAHGAYMTYASLDPDASTAPGQITAADLNDVYRVRRIDRETEVFGLIAGDTSYSMSPYIHNAAFRHSGQNRVFIPLQTANLGRFITRMVRTETREVELNFGGFSVTNPHKTAIMEFLYTIENGARKIGAVNTIKIDNGKLIGTNTDAQGFIRPLKAAFGDISNARASVLGNGGAARACIYALKAHGAGVTVIARDTAKAAALGAEFGISYAAWPDEGDAVETDILVNATPIGTKGQLEATSIASPDQLASVALVYDLTYNPQMTPLLSAARSAGCRTLGGLDMLIGQALAQFETWTGTSADETVMRSAAVNRLSL